MAYRNSSDVPLDAIIKRLHELSDAVVGGRKTQAQEFVMRVPAECDHDADVVLAEAAVRLDALRKYNAELQDENDNLRKANQDCVAWEKACKADLDRALARVVELESTLGDAWSSHCLEAVKWVDRAKEVLAQSDSAPWLLRKQAEAVEAAVDGLRNEHNGIPGTATTKKEKALLSGDLRYLERHAQRLRQQAGQQENTHD